MMNRTIMQFLYKSRKKIPESNDSAINTILAKQIEKGYLFVQGKWAQWMTKKTANISHTNLLVMWFFFIAFSAGYSMYLIVTSLSGVADIIVTPIVTSKLPEIDDDVIRKENSFTSTNEFEKINRFRIYIDSLARSPTGKKVHDSIVNNRPGLLDSLAAVENYYQSNFKNYTHGKKN